MTQAAKINYQLLMEDEIEKLNGDKKRLLLHVCCAPCSTFVLESLNKYFDISVFFYNPNIDSEGEFNRRLEEEKRFVKSTEYAKEIIVVPYNTKEYSKAILGLENEKEGGKRCESCFKLRLYKTAEYAKNMGFDYFTTSLTISPHKNAPMLNKIGEEAGGKFAVRFLNSDFKKKEGFKRSIVLSEEYKLYRQDYCGCIYSKSDMEKRQERLLKSEETKKELK